MFQVVAGFVSGEVRFLVSPQKIFMKILAPVKAARREVASTEHFIKDSALSRWESGQAHG